MIATGKTMLSELQEERIEVVASWDVERVREDFPVLGQTVNNKPLVYLDNAASSQVPQVVIDRGSRYLQEEHSNIHRGVHYLSQTAPNGQSQNDCEHPIPAAQKIGHEGVLFQK